MRTTLLVAALLLAACATTPVPTSTPAPTPVALSANEAALLAITKRLMTEPYPPCPEPLPGALAGDVLSVLTGQTVCVRLQDQDGRLLLAPAPAGVAGADTLIVRVFRAPDVPNPIVYIVNQLVAPLHYRPRPMPSGPPDADWPSVLPFGISVFDLGPYTTGVSLAGFGYLTRAEIDACQREVAARGLAASMNCALMPQQNTESVSIMDTTPQDDHPTCDAGHEQALADGVVTVRPGESICLRVRVHDDDVTPLAVASTYSPGDVVVFRMDRDVDPSVGKAMLNVRNPLDRPLRYEATLTRAGETSSEYTSICPVKPRRTNSEIWPYAISEMRLKGFRLLPTGTPAVCR